MKRTIIATLFSSPIIALALLFTVSLPTAAQSELRDGNQDQPREDMHEHMRGNGNMGQMHRQTEDMNHGDMHRGGSMGPMNRPMMRFNE